MEELKKLIASFFVVLPSASYNDERVETIGGVCRAWGYTKADLRDARLCIQQEKGQCIRTFYEGTRVWWTLRLSSHDLLMREDVKWWLKYPSRQKLIDVLEFEEDLLYHQGSELRMLRDLELELNERKKYRAHKKEQLAGRGRQ